VTDETASGNFTREPSTTRRVVRVNHNGNQYAEIRQHIGTEHSKDQFLLQLITDSKLKVLCMDVDESNSVESEYRILFGEQVKYILVDPGTYSSDILSFPPDFFDQLPALPLGEWTRARIFRRSGAISFELSYGRLSGVHTRWHSNVVDVLSLPLEGHLTSRVKVVKYGSKQAVAKIARFEFEIPRMEKETAIYQAIDGCGIGPAFLGHLIEHDRVIGILVEKVEGRRGDICDLAASQEIMKRLHSLGIVHGDLNRHNFIVSDAGITLVDFENAIQNGSQEAMKLEYEEIAKQLEEQTG
jgi:predicted Ser/Thr protein kinase